MLIVLEYVDGRDLNALLKALTNPTLGRPGFGQVTGLALFVVSELAEGVHHAHELKDDEGRPLGLVHRDIFSGNVLLSYSGEVKLSDFGLAKRSTDDSVVGATIKGSLGYMSPEQARRRPLDRRSDIYSLGAILFEMLTGRRLRKESYDAHGFQELVEGVVPDTRSFRPDLPDVVHNLLTRSLAPDPDERFSDVAAFVDAAREGLNKLSDSRANEAQELSHLLRVLLPPGSPVPSTSPARSFAWF